ncbi:DUF3341 domain-containing protein [Lignipirellula cremea]|uniref:Quinol:cytochrome c oxidoreductase membrane protein n=1 Tax=Lignipirellula cremea TaxID=2528010 RepID=A0A518E1Z6_9BACT|nr:DUF3341 domain-containing protein [Lignipirellula cremea]QDU98093.1 hypothetical protein Pla8534_59540 [Lignipirellula cremea]
MTAPPQLYGLLAEYDNPDQLVEAARSTYQAGYRRIEGYTPMPVEGLPEAMEFRRTRMPLVILLGAIFGAIAGYALQYWVAVIAYPINVGGRPLHTWPAFIPITFETTILCGSLAGVLGMLALNRLPRPHHPLFNVAEFSRATRDRFFLCVEARDPLFSLPETRELLQQTGALEVFDVPQ